jgi:hypothetical protein
MTDQDLMQDVLRVIREGGPIFPWALHLYLQTYHKMPKKQARSVVAAMWDQGLVNLGSNKMLTVPVAPPPKPPTVWDLVREE